MREIVKIVNNVPITRLKGTHGFYTVSLGPKKEATFTTQKEAKAFIEAGMPQIKGSTKVPWYPGRK